MPVKRDPRTGRWFFRSVVKYPDGRRERIFGTPGVPGAYQDLASTKTGAIEAENRAKAEARHGKPSTPIINKRTEVPTLSEYAGTFLALYKPGQKPSEYRTKQRILENQLLPTFGAMRLDEIRQDHIGAFVSSSLGRELSPKTINNRLAVLSSLLKFAATNHVISKPSLSFTTDAMDGEMVAVPMEDVDRLLRAADPRYRAVVLLAAEAGLRAGEVRGLQWTDLKDGHLTVRRALDTDTGQAIAPKHNKARVIALSERLTSELAALPRRGLWVCALDDGQPMGHRRDLYKPLLALYERAGVPVPPKPLHCLRHTFGTTLAANGVPLPVIQELMGHASVETTRRYIHVNEAQKRAAIAGAFGRGSHMAAETPNPRKS